MTIRDQAKKIATGASVALATSGLSSCNDNGAVDPLPPPLQCNTVDMGQSLAATGTRSADTVNVTVRNNISVWRVDRVTALSGASLLSTTLPRPGTIEPLELVLHLDSDTTTQATFRIEATLTGQVNDTCSVARTFTITLSDGGVEISSAGAAQLPLAARQRATIELARQEDRAMELVAHSPYMNPQDISWHVNAGTLDAATGARVRWTLPEEPGVYQAELVVDFGLDGLAFDVLLLEVSAGDGRSQRAALPSEDVAPA